MFSREGEVGLGPAGVAEIGPSGEAPSKQEERRGLEVARPGCSPGVHGDMAVGEVRRTRAGS